MAKARALLSVSDKTNLVEFAKALLSMDYELLSTGGTLKTLESAGLAVTAVDEYTGSPEVMDGRVKTLHPRVHGGLLGRRGTDDAELQMLGASWIDVVAVNLYPFEETLNKAGATEAELIENIDIGGPSMLRSAAKNHNRVTVVCDPKDYDRVIEEMTKNAGQTTIETRKSLATKVFAHTAAYDSMIAGWMSGLSEEDGNPYYRFVCLEKRYSLRYGENPHQKGAFYAERNAPAGSLALADSLGMGSKELSFNNIVDVEAAVEAVRDFPNPAAVVIKHASPCGLATAGELSAAYLAARDADAMSAFGGIVALNRPVDQATAQSISETFIECVIAPSFEEEALKTLRQKKALRLIATGEWLEADYHATQFKRVSGGFVLQDRDATGPEEVTAGQVVTKRAPTAAELSALAFAWVACKHVKSNAIVLASANADGTYATTGIGGGQTARVTAVRVACEAAGDAARGSVLASDAFFPFADGLEAAARAGVTAVVQPGGSKQDPEVIAAADAAGIAMIFTGVRHFRH